MPDVMSVKELSEYLGYSQTTIYRNVHVIPGKKIGWCWRFYKPLIDKIFKQTTHRSGWKSLKEKLSLRKGTNNV